MKNIDEIITAYGQMTDHISETDNARAELAQLRATIAAQERQLEEARIVIYSYRALKLGPSGYCSYPMATQHESASAWLAANAPAMPAAQAELEQRATADERMFDE